MWKDGFIYNNNSFLVINELHFPLVHHSQMCRTDLKETDDWRETDGIRADVEFCQISGWLRLKLWREVLAVFLFSQLIGSRDRRFWEGNFCLAGCWLLEYKWVSCQKICIYSFWENSRSMDRFLGFWFCGGEPTRILRFGRVVWFLKL